MASGSDEQLMDSSTKIKLLDGDIRCQIMRNTGKFPSLTELYGYNRNEMHHVYNEHMAFLKAGSNLIRTNTYHALYPFLNSLGAILNETDYEETVERAVQIAQESIRDYCINNNISQSSFKIVGSCGCFKDKILDDLPLHELKDAHRQRISILLKSEVDILSVEGIRSSKEVEMLFQLMREFTNTKFLVMFDGSLNFYNLVDLVNGIRDFYELCSSQITAIGWNNVSGKTAGRYCERIILGRPTKNLIPLVICTNRDIRSWNPVTVNSAACVQGWKKFGIHYIGGGNFVTAEDILPVREDLNRFTGIP